MKAHRCKQQDLHRCTKPLHDPKTCTRHWFCSCLMVPSGPSEVSSKGGLPFLCAPHNCSLAAGGVCAHACKPQLSRNPPPAPTHDRLRHGLIPHGQISIYSDLGRLQGLVLDGPKPRDPMKMSSLVSDPHPPPKEALRKVGAVMGSQVNLSPGMMIPATASRGPPFFSIQHSRPVEPSASTDSGKGGVGGQEPQRPCKPL